MKGLFKRVMGYGEFISRGFSLLSDSVAMEKFACRTVNSAVRLRKREKEIIVNKLSSVFVDEKANGTPFADYAIERTRLYGTE